MRGVLTEEMKTSLKEIERKNNKKKMWKKSIKSLKNAKKFLEKEKKKNR